MNKLIIIFLFSSLLQSCASHLKNPTITKPMKPIKGKIIFHENINILTRSHYYAKLPTKIVLDIPSEDNCFLENFNPKGYVYNEWISYNPNEDFTFLGMFTHHLYSNGELQDYKIIKKNSSFDLKAAFPETFKTSKKAKKYKDQYEKRTKRNLIIKSDLEFGYVIEYEMVQCRVKNKSLTSYRIIKHYNLYDNPQHIEGKRIHLQLN